MVHFMSKHVAVYLDIIAALSSKESCVETDIGLTCSYGGGDEAVYCLFNDAVTRSRNIASDL